jgi:hypothetical protein
MLPRQDTKLCHINGTTDKRFRFVASYKEKGLSFSNFIRKDHTESGGAALVSN